MTGNPVEDRRPDLTAMFESLVKKAQRPIEQQLAEPAAINLIFDGGGQPLVVGMGGILTIPFPCRILDCTMYAGIASTTGVAPVLTTANVYLGINTSLWAGGATELTGFAPATMTDTEQEELDISTWILNLQARDMIVYSLTEFTGTATLLTVSILVRKLDASGMGLDDIVSGSDSIVSDGASVVNHSS